MTTTFVGLDGTLRSSYRVGKLTFDCSAVLTRRSVAFSDALGRVDADLVAAKAKRWDVPRRVVLSGDVVGEVCVDGSDDVVMETVLMVPAPAAKRSLLGTFPGAFQAFTGTQRWYPREQVTINYAKAWLSQVGTVDAVVTLKRNGVSVGTVRVTAGTLVSPLTQLGIVMGETDYLTMDCSGNGRDLSCRLDY